MTLAQNWVREAIEKNSLPVLSVLACRYILVDFICVQHHSEFFNLRSSSVSEDPSYCVLFMRRKELLDEVWLCCSSSELLDGSAFKFPGISLTMKMCKCENPRERELSFKSLNSGGFRCQGERDLNWRKLMILVCFSLSQHLWMPCFSVCRRWYPSSSRLACKGWNAGWLLVSDIWSVSVFPDLPQHSQSLWSIYVLLVLFNSSYNCMFLKEIICELFYQ